MIDFFHLHYDIIHKFINNINLKKSSFKPSRIICHYYYRLIIYLTQINDLHLCMLFLSLTDTRGK